MAKRPVPLYDFAAFGQAIKAARTARKESRKDVSDAMNISPRYLTNIENKGQDLQAQLPRQTGTFYSLFYLPPNHETKPNWQSADKQCSIQK